MFCFSIFKIKFCHSCKIYHMTFWPLFRYTCIVNNALHIAETFNIVSFWLPLGMSHAHTIVYVQHYIEPQVTPIFTWLVQNKHRGIFLVIKVKTRNREVSETVCLVLLCPHSFWRQKFNMGNFKTASKKSYNFLFNYVTKRKK